MLIRDLIRKKCEKFLKDNGYTLAVCNIEVPKDRSLGDYSTNLAFLLAKDLKKAPQQIAEDLAKEIKLYFRDKVFKGTQVTALRGFINFILPKEFCIYYLSKEDFSKNLIAGGDKILLEFVSANPTGPLHIGHGRWAALGDSLRRILQWVGYEVSTEFYINDAGVQIEKLKESIEARKQGIPVPEDGYNGSYVKELVTFADPIQELIRRQQETLRQFRVKFDNWYSEKQNLQDTQEVAKTIEWLTDKGFTYKLEGALFFRTTSFGDDKDRVLIKENGETTYFAADIAYHNLKVQRGFNRLINIWGADHHGYIKRVKAGLKAMCGDQAELEVLLGQLVTLYQNGVEVRMSKRTGDMITLQEVIEKIGADAARFFLVMKSADIHLDFDLELAKKKSNDNPVFYVQYAHARISSIIRKSNMLPVYHRAVELKEIEFKLLKFLMSFEEEVFTAAQYREPYRIAHYLIELSGLFHSFYHECKVNVEDRKLSENRLAIINSVKNILGIGLGLMGIDAPERM
ncbi:MAG: arginine--tRNA ligase [Candidatus Margulisbacteria bacterium]|nr:arginine--tRNA ligase [Candidatus Margulisiibacteriota bacterium]